MPIDFQRIEVKHANTDLKNNIFLRVSENKEIVSTSFISYA